MSIQDKFSSVVYYGNYKIEKSLYDFYPFYEVYNPDKFYSKEKFEANFDSSIGIATYQYILLSSNTLNIVVAQEIIDDESEDFKDLQKYCDCKRCQIYKLNCCQKITSVNFWLSFVSCSYCGACNGCLYSGSSFLSHWRIKNAKELRNKKN